MTVLLPIIRGTSCRALGHRSRAANLWMALRNPKTNGLLQLNLKKVIFETNALISKMKVNLFTKTSARDRHAILPLDWNWHHNQKQLNKIPMFSKLSDADWPTFSKTHTHLSDLFRLSRFTIRPGQKYNFVFLGFWGLKNTRKYNGYNGPIIISNSSVLSDKKLDCAKVF